MEKYPLPTPCSTQPQPKLLILNQMAGPMTWEFAEDAGETLGCVAVLTGHPDTLAKGSTEQVRLYPAATYRRGSFFRRALSWLHYAWQAFWWLGRWDTEIPVLLFSNPPILCWVGYLLKKLRGQRYAVMVHDIYPDVLVKIAGFAPGHPLIRLWNALNRRAYENAEVVMTLGEYMAAALERQFDPRRTPLGRVEVIYPWVDTEKIHPLPKAENPFARQHQQVDKFTVMYSGNMGLGHDIETMLAAAQLLRENERIHFMFIGAGPKWELVAQTIQEQQLSNVTLLPWQPEETLPYSLSCADVALVSLEPGMEGLAVPSKAIYAIGAGAYLLLFASGENDISAWIERYAFGTVLPPDARQVADRIRMLSSSAGMFQDCKSKSRQVAASVFSRRANAGRVLTLAQCVSDGC